MSRSCLTPLHRRVLRAIDQDQLIPAGGRVAVALSGGGDSVALAAILADLAVEADWSVACLFHVNHQLRGAASDADEGFCEVVARDLEVPIQVARIDVGARAQADRTSIESAGHRVRYEQFVRLVAEGKTDRVATAHTMDDLAETVLLRLVRGAGPSGLAGIRRRAGDVIRPLLDVRRDELRGFLRERGLQYRDDPSNQDMTVLRNRVRHRVLPVLERECSPAVAEALARAAAIAGADADWIGKAVKGAEPGVIQVAGEELAIDVSRLMAAPPALAQRLVRLALQRVGGRRVGFHHVAQVLQMARAAGSGSPRVDLPGVQVEWRDGRLHCAPPSVRRRRGRPGREVCPDGESNGFEYPLPVPGEAAIPELGLRVSAAPAAASSLRDPRGTTVAMRASDLTPPLLVRNWRPGDSFRPLGLGGRAKKLQDFFVDRKIRRADRHSIPLVIDPRLGVVWVAGHGLAEDVRINAPDEGVLVLKVRKLGGMG
ncbi:MAG: tRNA lysidine(34) synthetase TilS [Acidobacteria bacterium]|nr:tRNA lysidine(34) synthetase TilS [Acidobacteriota bacterium]